MILVIILFTIVIYVFKILVNKVYQKKDEVKGKMGDVYDTASKLKNFINVKMKLI